MSEPAIVNATGGWGDVKFAADLGIDKRGFHAFRNVWRVGFLSEADTDAMKDRAPVYFTTPTPLQERAGLSAQVDRVAFAPDFDAPPDRPHPFVYSVSVLNESSSPVTIKARKWVLKDLVTGKCHVVEGDGVAGRMPRLLPGEVFRYDSYHVVAADSTAEGAFLACDDAGQPLLVRVPAFRMSVSQ